MSILALTSTPKQCYQVQAFGFLFYHSKIPTHTHIHANRLQFDNNYVYCKWASVQVSSSLSTLYFYICFVLGSSCILLFLALLFFVCFVFLLSCVFVVVRSNAITFHVRFVRRCHRHRCLKSTFENTQRNLMHYFSLQIEIAPFSATHNHTITQSH